MLLLATLCSRPPVSRAAPQPEKLQKNNITKKKKLVEVRRLNCFAFNLILMFLDLVEISVFISHRYLNSSLWPSHFLSLVHSIVSSFPVTQIVSTGSHSFSSISINSKISPVLQIWLLFLYLIPPRGEEMGEGESMVFFTVSRVV